MILAQQAWMWLKSNLPTIFWICFVASIFVEVTPIKINPWKKFFNWIGKLLTGNACSKLDGVIIKIDNIEKDVIENEKDRIRWEILDFANTCRNGRQHTRDEFQHIIDLNIKYKKLLEKTKDENGVFSIEMKYIEKIYAERLEKNDFLT